MAKYTFGTGRRKSAIAQVRVLKGSGKIAMQNGKPVSPLIVEKIAEVLSLVSKEKSFDITIITNGGGEKSQAEASRLAVSRAISKIDPDAEKTMKKEGFLTRDPREKERKKPGLKRARRAPQWAKR